VQRYAIGPSPHIAPPLVHEVLQTPGEPLHADTRRDAEATLGYEFSNIRIHADSKAAESADAVGARAYAFGQHIVFGSHEFEPSTRSGHHLLVHELTHTVQRRADPPSIPAVLEVGERDSPAEHEAEQTADRATAREEQRPPGGSLSSVLDALLPADEVQRARLLGSTFAPFAVGVDGRWLAGHLDAGAPLDPALRSEMEGEFGHDFSRVRIHRDRGADLVAHSLNAHAFTIGPHIAFADGAFDPQTKTGRALLKHELTHVMQQSAVSSVPSHTIPLTRPGHQLERQAEALATSREKAPATLAPQAHVSLSVCGVLVEATCWAFFSAIAAAVAALCTVGSVVTVGGLAIPCTAVIIAAAAGAAWDAVLCTNILKQEICDEPIESGAPATAPGA
jgi:hypothetical protein